MTPHPTLLAGGHPREEFAVAGTAAGVYKVA